MTEELKPCPHCAGRAREEGRVTFWDDPHPLVLTGGEMRAERTCRWKNVEGTLFVSECGGSFDRVVPDAYCPNCEARVEEEL